MTLAHWLHTFWGNALLYWWVSSLSRAQKHRNGPTCGLGSDLRCTGGILQLCFIEHCQFFKTSSAPLSWEHMYFSDTLRGCMEASWQYFLKFTESITVSLKLVMKLNSYVRRQQHCPDLIPLAPGFKDNPAIIHLCRAVDRHHHISSTWVHGPQTEAMVQLPQYGLTHIRSAAGNSACSSWTITTIIWFNMLLIPDFSQIQTKWRR